MKKSENIFTGPTLETIVNSFLTKKSIQIRCDCGKEVNIVVYEIFRTHSGNIHFKGINSKWPSLTGYKCTNYSPKVKRGKIEKIYLAELIKRGII